ncbi:MAG: 1-acyl-sn-glycerol-3-phosphate acyltransferase [Rhodothermales bacterium]|nr:1-acyl-sn-glycerol-3-phosphate acyltransferase [Rhodothermales bacterium]
MRAVVRIFRLIRFAVTLVGHAVVLQLTSRTQRKVSPGQHASRALRHASQAFVRILKIDVQLSNNTEGLSSPGLIVCNHLGVTDPLILASQLDICFAAKSEMEKWPVMGPVCKSVGTVFVQRDRRMATSQFVDDIVSRLKDGVSVLVFPEGTTSSGDTIRPFKTGSFEAMTYLRDRMIVPILLHVKSVNGSSAVSDKRLLSWFEPGQSLFGNFWKILGIKGAEVEICVGNPINVGKQSRKELAEIAFAAMQELHERLNPLNGSLEPKKS